MRVNFLGLQAFVAIAERGSFQVAATFLNLSQTALSHRIRRLEEELGTRLFVRSTRALTLTEAGSKLLPRVRGMIGELSTLLDEVRDEAEAPDNSITIGCLPTIALVVLGPSLASFRKQFPDVTVHVHDKSASELAELLADGIVEFAVTIPALLRWDLQMQPLHKDSLVLVCRTGDFEPGVGAVDWSELVSRPLIRIGPHTGNRMDDALGSRRDNLDWHYEVQHAATAVALVKAGLGVSIVPEMAIAKEALKGLRVVRLKNPHVRRQIGIVSKRDRPLSPMADQLRRIIAKTLVRRTR